MPSRTSEWPAWPEFVIDKSVDSADGEDDDFLAAKRAIVAEYGDLALRESWHKACAALTTVTQEIIERGQDVFPCLDMKDVEAGSISDDQRDELRKTGCFIIREVIDPVDMEGIFIDLKKYTRENKGRYTGWPAERRPSLTCTTRLRKTPCAHILISSN